MNRRGFLSGLVLMTTLAGLTAAHSGLSSSVRAPDTGPANAFPPSPSPMFDPVDPALVGTWTIMVPYRGGQSLWIWQMIGNGTYKFHADPFRSARPHEGIMSAANGHWTLRALKGVRGYLDGGTYEVNDATALIKGKLGTGTWKRLPE
jgi:hypothetical protein